MGYDMNMMMKETVMTDKTPSKRSVAIAIINENAQEPVPFVVGKIAEAIGVTEANAKSYYRYIVKNGLSVLPTDLLAKTPKAPKTKTIKAVVTKTENGGVRIARAPKVAKAPKKVDDSKKFPVIGPDGQTVMRTADEIKEAIERIRLRDQLRAEGATGFAANFNYKTREFEPDISETNDVEDLCALFNV